MVYLYISDYITSIAAWFKPAHTKPTFQSLKSSMKLFFSTDIYWSKRISFTPSVS